jgi:hypothetical protein
VIGIVKHVHAGDEIPVKAQDVEGSDRRCLVMSVLGAEGGPPYVVLWPHSGSEKTFFPGSNAFVMRRGFDFLDRRAPVPPTVLSEVMVDYRSVAN